MSHIETQYMNENVVNYQIQPTIMSTSHYLISENVYRMPVGMIDGSIQFNDGHNNTQNFTQNSMTYQPNTPNQKIDIYRNEGNNGWGTMNSTPNYEALGHENISSSLISWNGADFSQAYIQGNSTSDEKIKNYVIINDNIQDSNLNGYTIFPSANNTNMNCWKANQSMGFSPKDDSNATLECKNNGIRKSQDIVNKSNIIGPFSVQQSQYPYIYEHSLKHMDINQFPKSWLISNFERVEDECTIARILMYSYYVLACEERGEVAMNSAGLGKVIRNIFGSIRNRRLGSRGDSRYHYLGVRVKESSYINSIPKETVSKVIDILTKNSKIKYIKPSTFEKLNSNCISCLDQPDYSIHDLELKCLEEIDNQPLCYFTKTLESIKNFSINIEYNKNEKEDDNIQYKLIFKEINKSLTKHYCQIIECFSQLNDELLWKCVKEYWDNEQVNICGYERTIKECVEDKNIEKYIIYYDYTALQILLDNLLGDIRDYMSVSFYNKIIELFYTLHNVFTQELCNNLPENFVKIKDEIILKVIDIVIERKSIDSLRINLIRNISRYPHFVLTYNTCLNGDINKYMKDFYTKNMLVLNTLTVPIHELEQFYTKLSIISVQNNSSEWINVVENQIMSTINNNPNDIISNFIHDWCIYHNLLGEHLSSYHQLPCEVYLNNFAIKILKNKLIDINAKARMCSGIQIMVECKNYDKNNIE